VSPYLRTVKTSSGATAVQIVYSSQRGSRDIEHIGSAHDDTGLSVSQARVLVEYRVRIEQPKSRNGKRTLPLDGELVTALATLRKRQLDESAVAGIACRSGLAGLDWYQGGEYVNTDEAGTAGSPGVVLRRVRPPAPQGRAAADHLARLASHDPDAPGARGRADLHHQQVGGALRLGVHPEDLRPRKR
jgi:hypothetical protein